MRCYFMQKTKPLSDGSYKVHPCGHCLACRKAYATEWAIRSYFESLGYDECTFLNLTYDDEHLPPSKAPLFAGSLVKEHIQTFMKNLRYYVGKCRYFCAGEYGDRTFRPHYHLILYGVDVHNSVFYDLFYSKSKQMYIGRCKCWSYGTVAIGPVDVRTCFYVAKYSLKVSKEDYAILKQYNQQKPFFLMSRNPGLGFDYLKKEEFRLRHDGFIRFKGSKIRIPRYYFDKLYPVGSDEREVVQLRKQEILRKINDDYYKNYNSLGKTKYYIDNRLGEQQEKNILRRCK